MPWLLSLMLIQRTQLSLKASQRERGRQGCYYTNSDALPVVSGSIKNLIISLEKTIITYDNFQSSMKGGDAQCAQNLIGQTKSTMLIWGSPRPRLQMKSSAATAN